MVLLHKSLDIRYIAGFFDGEGCIDLYLRQDLDHAMRFVLQVSIAQTRPAVLKQIGKRFGGHLAPPRNKCTVHLLMFTSAAAGRFLKAILPHLIVKKREAEIALEYRSLVKRGTYGSGWGGNTIPKKTRRRMFTLWKELMTLPGRGKRLGKRSSQILGGSIA